MRDYSSILCYSKESNLSTIVSSMQQPEVNPNLLIGERNDHFTADESGGFTFQITESVKKHIKKTNQIIKE